MAAETQPAPGGMVQSGAHLTVAATFRDEKTNALYVHRDLVPVLKDWEVEGHVSPVKADERFGDVESFHAYVKRFAGAEPYQPYITWNSQGIRAVLDYHGDITEPGRCQWTATYPFTRAPEWNAWVSLCGGPVNQRTAIEKLEELADTIVTPQAAELMGLLRSLRANVKAEAETALKEDGSAAISFKQERSVGSTNNGVTLPPEIVIGIPVLAGHVNAEGKPVRYQMRVRVRPSVDDSAHLTLRFAIQNAERVMEEVYAERVAAAKALLGDEYPILRSAG